MGNEQQADTVDLLPAGETRRRVNAHFRAQANYWDEIYRSRTVFALIHQRRLAAVLSLVDQLSLRPGSRVLEVGCGAGLIAACLAQRGFMVEAVDSVDAMIRLTRERAEAAGVGQFVITSLGDIQHLAFQDNQFSLVLAIGVIPWLSSPRPAIQEMARVVHPGGYLIFTMDNLWRLDYVLDPLKSPIFSSVRRAARKILGSPGLSPLKWVLDNMILPSEAAQPETERLSTHCHSIQEVDGAIAGAGLKKVGLTTLGFGPFSFFDREILPGAVGVKLHRALQRMADRQWPWIRSAGGQFLTLARKSGAGDSLKDTVQTESPCK
jgi:ubiquinone/menaquinone biosynthesis C-methylase UbiE